MELALPRPEDGYRLLKRYTELNKTIPFERGAVKWRAGKSVAAWCGSAGKDDKEGCPISKMGL
jgi:hypothetical protein